jgi:hypothetical protein
MLHLLVEQNSFQIIHQLKAETPHTVSSLHTASSLHTKICSVYLCMVIRRYVTETERQTDTAMRTGTWQQTKCPRQVN